MRDRHGVKRARGANGVNGARAAALAALLAVPAGLPLCTPAPALAQAPPSDSTATRAAERHRLERAPDYMRIGKWTALAGGLGAAGYGFLSSLDVDDRYERLEALCASDPVRCGLRAPDGAYLDPELERGYQEVLRRNRRAKRSLVAGQLGVAASAVLYVLDLRRRGPPPNIPFDPARLLVEPGGDGAVRIGVRLPIGGTA